MSGWLPSSWLMLTAAAAMTIWGRVLRWLDRLYLRCVYSPREYGEEDPRLPGDDD